MRNLILTNNMPGGFVDSKIKLERNKTTESRSMK